jgi:hypothetical protein
MISSSVTLYTRRCSSVIRLDQSPLSSCLSGSGLPMPVKGVRSVSDLSLQKPAAETRSAS